MSKQNETIPVSEPKPTKTEKRHEKIISYGPDCFERMIKMQTVILKGIIQPFQDWLTICLPPISRTKNQTDKV